MYTNGSSSFYRKTLSNIFLLKEFFIRSNENLFVITNWLQPKAGQLQIIKPDSYVLVASKKWRGRRLNDILTNEKLIDFYESDQTSLNYLKQFNLGSTLSRPRLFVNNNEAIIKLFCQGIGFGTLTTEIAKPYLDKGNLITLNGGAMMDDPLALAWYPRPEMPKYLKAIIDSIK